MPNELEPPAAGTTLKVLRELCEAYALRPISSIAVVGNAPLQPSAKRAQAIDEADLVFRVNGYRSDINGAPAVGERTDVVVFNRALRATPWFFGGYRDRLHLLVEPGRIHWERPDLPTWWPSDLGFLTVPNDEVTIPACADIGVDVMSDPRWPTTGTLAVWMARHLFPEAELRLAGFSFLLDRAQTSWNHATGLASPVGAEHSIDREGELVARWCDEGLARVF